MSSETGLPVVVGWPKEDFVHTALLVWLNILPSHKNHSFEGDEDHIQDHGEGIEKTIRIPGHRIAVSKLKGSSAALERRAKTPNPNFTLTAVVRPSWRFHFASDRLMVKKDRGGVP